MNKLKIAVIFGGPSVEHDVSIISGIQVIDNLDKDKYEVMPIYWSREGKFLTTPASVEGRQVLKKIFQDKLEAEINPGNKSLAAHKTGLLGSTREFRPDVVFPVMHGSGGEDGALQGLLEVMGVPYVGSNVGASFLSMDKNAFKEVMKANGLNILPWILVPKENYSPTSLRELTKQSQKDSGGAKASQNDSSSDLKFPVIVKPNSLGSSIGVSKCENDKELKEALELVFELDMKALIEPFITDMIEVNCAVLGNVDSQMASVCERPISKGELLNFEDKYLAGGKGGKKTGGKSLGMASLDRVIPADIDPKLAKEVQETAKEVFRVVGCSGNIRVDFIVRGKNHEVLVNEINPIPGSYAYYLWEATGISFRELLDKAVDIALKDHNKKTSLKRSFDSPVLEKFLEE